MVEILDDVHGIKALLLSLPAAVADHGIRAIIRYNLCYMRVTATERLQ